MELITEKADLMAKRYFPAWSGRIEICGGIAAGKTTLARMLSLFGMTACLENFQANPFWRAFYADPVETAFETEITFLLQHYHEIKATAKIANTFVCDFSLLLDVAYARVTLNSGQRKAFSAVYGEICRALPKPNLVIHLVCDPAIELERIRQRGRDVEQSVTVDYLASVNLSLGHVLNKGAKSWNVLTIDSAVVDFANDEADQQRVLESVHARLVIASGC